MESVGPAHRHTWLDRVKGMAMVLVLLFHAESVGDRFVPMPEVVGVVNRFFSPFFIPAFMFVSGLMVARALTKPGSRYFGDRLREIVWPYVLWSFVFLIVADRLEVPKSFAAILLVPPTYLWYLWFLFAFYVIAWVMNRWSVPTWGVAIVAFALAFGPDDFRISRFAFLLLFFLAGDAYSRRCGIGPVRSPRPLLMAGVSLVATCGFGVLSALRFDIQYNPLFVVAPIVGLFVAVVGARALADGVASRVLGYVGRNSLAFYVVHFPIMWVVDRELGTWGAASGWGVYVTGLAASAVASTLVVGLSERWAPARLLLALPRRESGVS